MHAPSKINIEDFDELVASFRVGIAADGSEECWHINVGPDDAVEYPFDTEVGDTFKAFLERVLACNGDCVARRKTLSRE
jgi:hypothetical protein